MKDIVIRDVAKAYGDKIIFKNLNLTLQAGERYALVAPSGTGKTTLLRLLLGLENADAGTIEGMPDHASVVFQEDRLCEDFSALENVTLVMNTKDKSKEKKAKATALLEELGLGDSIHKKAGKLSGGMKRRLSLARALAFESDLLILDEPFEGLDQQTRQETLEVLERHMGNRTLILVSHASEDLIALHTNQINL